MSKNNDIIDFLIECLVISNFSNNSNIQKNNFKNHFKNNLGLSSRLISVKLDKHLNVKNLEKDYMKYDCEYSKEI